MRFFASILLILAILVLSHCKKKSFQINILSEIFNHTWGTNDNIFIENGKYHSFKKLDTVNFQMVGDTLIPLEILSDGGVVIKKLTPSSMEMRNKDGITDFVITGVKFRSDTFYFAIKRYINKNLLLLYSSTTASRVYDLKNKKVELQEIDFLKQPKYTVEGYLVGDQVNRDEIDILYADNFGTTVTEEAVLIRNRNIEFTLIGKYYIEKIKQVLISDQELDPLIHSIDKVFSIDHEYEEMISGEGQYKEIRKGYYWNEKDVSINIQKVESNVDETNENFWTLEYSNFIITNILQNYLTAVPENI